MLIYLVFMGTVFILYMYHRNEIESGNEGLPGMQDFLQSIDQQCGTKITPTVKKTPMPKRRKRIEETQPLSIPPREATTMEEQIQKPEPERPQNKGALATSHYIEQQPTADNQGEKVQKAAPAWVPQSKPTPFSEDKDMVATDRNPQAAPPTMAAVAAVLQRGAGTPIDKNLYPTYRPIFMKLDEKTAQSISDSDSDKPKKKDKHKKDGKKKEKKKKGDKKKKAKSPKSE